MADLLPFKQVKINYFDLVVKETVWTECLHWWVRTNKYIYININVLLTFGNPWKHGIINGPSNLNIMCPLALCVERKWKTNEKWSRFICRVSRQWNGWKGFDQMLCVDYYYYGPVWPVWPVSPVSNECTTTNSNNNNEKRYAISHCRHSKRTYFHGPFRWFWAGMIYLFSF